MFRGIMLLSVALLVGGYKPAIAQEFNQSQTPRTQILFTDPFEDSDDLLAILSFINEATQSQDQFYLVTANEIVDEQGHGLRAMALYQFLVQLASATDTPMNAENRQKLNTALEQGRLQIIQGQVSQRFQQDYQQFLTSGKADTHFYNPGLVKQFYQNPSHPQGFQSIHQLRNRLLNQEENRRLTLLGIASSNDIAVLFLDDPDLIRDDFSAQGSPEQQIEQARQYYQNKLNALMQTHRALPYAQQLAARVDLFWQMSGGFDHQEEYNEKQSRVASDYLNHLFSAANHGITPINTTSLLHPVAETLKDAKNSQWPIDEQLLQTQLISGILKENLSGQGDDGIHPFTYPGFFNKTYNSQPIKSLNHDTLALVESTDPHKQSWLCQLEYSFNMSKQKLSRSYVCKPGTQAEGQAFSISVSSLTDGLYAKRTDAQSATDLLNQKTDARVMDVLFHLFSKAYNRLGIFDFDCTITVDESFKHSTDDPAVVQSNTKDQIAAVLRKNGAIFAINSFIDSPDNIVIYLQSIYQDKPRLIAQQAYYLPNKKRGKEVLAFNLSQYAIANLPAPVYVTTLPKRTGEIDPQTGEKNLAYRMAMEALEGSGKNIPSTVMAQLLLQNGFLSPKTQSAFYDDNLENAQYAVGFMLFDYPMTSYVVTPHIKQFEVRELH